MAQYKVCTTKITGYFAKEICSSVILFLRSAIEYQMLLKGALVVVVFSRKRPASLLIIAQPIHVLLGLLPMHGKVGQPCQGQTCF